MVFLNTEALDNAASKLIEKAKLSELPKFFEGEGAYLEVKTVKGETNYYKASLKSGDFKAAFENGDIDLNVTKVEKAQFDNAKNQISISYDTGTHNTTVNFPNGVTLSGNKLKEDMTTVDHIINGIKGYQATGLLKGTDGSHWEAEFQFSGARDFTLDTSQINKFHLTRSDEAGQTMPAKARGRN